MTEIVQREEFSRTSAVLGMEFDACSLAAREANEQAEQLLAGKTHRETLHIVQDPEAGSAIEKQFEVIDLRSVKLDCDIDEVAQLKLVRPRGMRRRHKDIGPHARLVAVVRGDIAVPIAGFARRKTESGCDFVQLEAEMHDENYVVLPRDVRSDSVKVITAIMRSKPTQQQEQQMRGMVQEALGRNAEKIEEEFAPALAREVRRYVSKPRLVGVGSDGVWMSAPGLRAYSEKGLKLPADRLKIPNAVAGTLGAFGQEVSLVARDTVTTRQMLVRYVRFGQIRLGSGRIAQLALINEAPEEKDADMHFVAMTRKSVAVPLLSFSHEHGAYTVLPDGSKESASRDTAEIVHRLLSDYPSDRAKQLYEKIHSAIQGEIYPSNSKLKSAATRDNAFSGQIEYEVEKPVKEIDLNEIVMEATRTADMREDQNPLQVLRALDEELTENAYFITRVLTALPVENRITEILGVYDRSREALIADLGKLASTGKRFTGRLEKFPVNGEETDVDVFAEVLQENGGHRLLLRGRPAVYRERRPSVLYDTIVHPARELELEPDEVSDIQRLLGSLSVAINRHGGGKVLSTGASSANALWE